MKVQGIAAEIRSSRQGFPRPEVMSLAVKKGFTLIEMLVSVSIASIMAAMAVSSFQSTLTSTRMSSEISALQQALNLARSEAIKRGQSVSICPASGCAGSDWSAGWNVVLENSQGTQLLTTPALTHGDTLTNSKSSHPTIAAVGYTFFNGTITLHDSSNTASMSRCIIFSAGTWSVQTGANCP